jgi:hypothetical protein
MPPVRLERLAKLAFDQIRQASATTPAVLIRQLEAIRRLAPRLPDACRQALSDQADAILETASALVSHLIAATSMRRGIEPTLRAFLALNHGDPGEAALQIVGQGLSLRRIPRDSQGEDRAILHLPVLGQRKSCHCRRLCGELVSVEGFPQRRSGFKSSRLLSMSRLLRQIACPP